MNALCSYRLYFQVGKSALLSVSDIPKKSIFSSRGEIEQYKALLLI